MQTMNTDQPSYYSNQTGQAAYFVPSGSEPHYSIRNLNQFPQQMHLNQQFYPNAYAQQGYYVPSIVPNQTFVQSNNPRPMNPQNIPIIRPANENPIGPQNYNQPSLYPAYQQHQNLYSPQQFNTFPGQGYQVASQPQYHSQPSTQSVPTSQQSLHEQQPSHPQPAPEKRQRKPLAIVDPKSHEAIKVAAAPTQSNNTTAVDESATDSTPSSSKPTDDTNKSNTQEKFRKDFAAILNKNSQSDKDINQQSPKDDQTDDSIQQSAPSSRSSSISKTSSEPNPRVVVSEVITEDKPTQDPNPIEPEPVDSKSPSDDNSYEIVDGSSPLELLEHITPTPMNDSEPDRPLVGKTSSGSKRLGYTIEELRQKQASLLSQERPFQLKEIPGVTSPALPPLPAKPEIDPDEKFVRDVTAILNKLTPQNYDKLVQKLDKLELNSAKRLEAMISVMFIKAVEAAIFCSIYAKLCKHFQKKQVTVPTESGQQVTFFFRQILLTRCQKEFECDYRQNIRYEERKVDVDAIVDDKVRREAAEQLEEDLLKAKRKKLGNITFIGELFKLQMLTDTIMYDCVDYLLRDKSDEESLECLCKLITNIGKELDMKANEKAANRKSLDKNYVDLENISTLRQTSARIRFMIQDLMDMKKANWVARRAEIKPTTIDEIHETERLKREQQDFDRERDRQQQRRDYNRSGGGGPQQYTGSRDSRGSGVKQQSNRSEDDRGDSRVIASLKHQLNEKKNTDGPQLNFAPPRPWGKGSGVDKKAEDDRSNTGRTGKPLPGNNTPLRSKTGGPPGTPGYFTQRQPSRELARQNSSRDRENVMESLRKTTSATGPTNPNNTASRESSRNASPQSNNPPKIEDKPNASFDEEKTRTHVHSLIEEYTENYTDSNDRPVLEAIEDLTSFCTANPNQQALVVQELFTNVLEAKPRARKAVGHLLDVALNKNTLSTAGFLSGMKMFIEIVPDYAVDIPLIWQYVAEILGAFIGAPSSNMNLLKPILELVPEKKSKQLFQDIIRYAVEFSSKAQIQKFWQLAGFTLNDLLKADSSSADEYNWLNEPIESEPTPTPTPTDNQLPDADPQLVKLFKAINDQGTTVTDDQIKAYIKENMNPDDKHYIHNIVLSYLEACLVNREPNKKIQEDIAKKRMTVLNAIIGKRTEAELQAVYAIQNFVHKLEHPPKMAQLLFDIFYDEECVSEETFFQWLENRDQSKIDGHAVVVISTQDFFTWLQQADPEGDEEEVEGGES